MYIFIIWCQKIFLVNKWWAAGAWAIITITIVCFGGFCTSTVFEPGGETRYVRHENDGRAQIERSPSYFRFEDPSVGIIKGWTYPVLRHKDGKAYHVGIWASEWAWGETACPRDAGIARRGNSNATLFVSYRTSDGSKIFGDTPIEKDSGSYCRKLRDRDRRARSPELKLGCKSSENHIYIITQ